MKPLERVFFQACVMNKQRGLSIRDICNLFAMMGFPIKRLWYYLEKWSGRGFYEYGVTLDLGWFIPQNFKGEYKVMFEELKQQI